MSATQRVSRIATLLGVVASVATVAANASLRSRISTLLGTTTSGGIWRLAAIVLAITNAKNFPFTWHVGVPYCYIHDVEATSEREY